MRMVTYAMERGVGMMSPCDIHLLGHCRFVAHRPFYYYVSNPRAFGSTRMLLTVIGIATVRNIAENIYFGLYFGGKSGAFPQWTVEVLGRPDLLILPKI